MSCFSYLPALFKIYRMFMFFRHIKTTLRKIYEAGGRNSETDLFGNKGAYVPILSKKTNGKPCPVCGEPIRKENYMGGSIYYCFHCQRQTTV